MELNQVTVPAVDVEKSVDFYRRLGLRLMVYDVGSYARFECGTQLATFSVHKVEGVEAGEGPVVYFECVDLDAEVERLKMDGFEFEVLPVDQPWLWREAYLRDPYGNRVCLYFAGENRLNPPWRLDQER